MTGLFLLKLGASLSVWLLIWDRVFLGNPGRPWTHDTSSLPNWKLAFSVCTTTHSSSMHIHLTILICASFLSFGSQYMFHILSLNSSNHDANTYWIGIFARHLAKTSTCIKLTPKKTYPFHIDQTDLERWMCFSWSCSCWKEKSGWMCKYFISTFNAWPNTSVFLILQSQPLTPTYLTSLL